MFIKLTENLILNSDHVISTHYEPPYKWLDEESGESRKTPARLTLTTTAIEIEEISGYDGTRVSAASTSTVHKFAGEEADDIWGQFLRMAAL